MERNDSASLLADRIRRGLTTIVVGTLPPLPRTIGLVRVRCDVASTLSPLERARDRIEHVLEGGTSDTGPSARRMALGDDFRRPIEERLAAACDRLAARAPGRVALVLEGIDRADASTHASLARLLREGKCLLPFVLVIGGEPRGSFLDVIRALEDGEDARARAAPPLVRGSTAAREPAGTGHGPNDLDADARRVLRAAAVIGSPFDADLVGRLLDLSTDEVLEALQRARDAGASIADLGDGHFEMAQEPTEALLASMLPSLRRRWQERLAELLSEGRPDPLRSAAHLDAAGHGERALERRLDAVAMLVRAGDVHRASDQLAAVIEELDAIPRDQASAALHARAKIERARLRWLGAALEPSLSLDGALEMAFEARAELGSFAPPALQADVASMIAGIAYDLGDGASLERADAALASTIAALLDRGATVEAATLSNDQAALQLRMGRVERAAELLARSRAMLEARVKEAPGDTASRADLADTYHLLARLPLHVHRNGRTQDRGDAIAAALGHACAAEAAYRDLGRRRDVARVTETIARLEALRGDARAARAAFTTALRIADEVMDLTGLARITAGLAELLSAEGTPHEALGMLASSIELNREKGSPVGLAFDERILEEVERAVTAMPHPDPVLLDELAQTRARLVAAIEASSA